MAKTILGIDIGYDHLKLALVNGTSVKKIAEADMPEKLLKEGRVVSIQTAADLIKSTMRENGIHARNAAIIISDEVAFVKNVTMPQMTMDQLAFNLPYEFRDYSNEDLKGYVYDYAMLSTPDEMASRRLAAEADDGQEQGEEGGATMELMAAAVPQTFLEECRDMLRKAGLKMVKAAPAVSCYAPLIRRINDDPDKEYCIIDLGHNAIKMYIFRGDRNEAIRVLDIGLNSIDDVISDVYSVDVHLAHTYIMTNHENCLHKEETKSAFDNIAVELMRALNFYQFRNPDSRLSDAWIVGGGAHIKPLVASISNMLEQEIHMGSELIPGGENMDGIDSCVMAAGITMD